MHPTLCVRTVRPAPRRVLLALAYRIGRQRLARMIPNRCRAVKVCHPPATPGGKIVPACENSLERI
jgi:hypothetical protein